MNFIDADGKLLSSSEPVWLASNRSYRYGDGLFETIRMTAGRLPLIELHLDRFFSGLDQLNYRVPAHFTRKYIHSSILRLCEKNEHGSSARIRLSAARGDGGLNDVDNSFHYLLESWALPATFQELNSNGLVLGVYPNARKSCDALAGLKSASFLCYAMAARYARQQQWNDALVLNTNDSVADSSIANLFLVKDGTIITPSLDQGCVAGVMRKFLLTQLKQEPRQWKAVERAIAVTELEDADEIFLTNAISGVRWVGEYGNKKFDNDVVQKIYAGIVSPLFNGG